VGPETVVALGAAVTAFLTWNHQQRQRVIDTRFDSVKNKIESVETRLNELPIKYVLKADLEVQLDDIRRRLSSINDKLDQLIMKDKP
jgi:hypothetical protein